MPEIAPLDPLEDRYDTGDGRKCGACPTRVHDGRPFCSEACWSMADARRRQRENRAIARLRAMGPRPLAKTWGR